MEGETPVIVPTGCRYATIPLMDDAVVTLDFDRSRYTCVRHGHTVASEHRDTKCLMERWAANIACGHWVERDPDLLVDVGL
jgi:hypothetical protein